ncbi:MAG: HIRAN domain-containing protein [Anaerolineales bacterium]|jgi:hypothetical protein
MKLIDKAANPKGDVLVYCDDETPDIIHTKIVGVDRKNDDGSDRQTLIKRNAKPGQYLKLKPEPDNKYDPNAIGVWWGDVQFGYISSDLAKDLKRRIDEQEHVKAITMNLTGGTPDKPSHGVNIDLFFSDKDFALEVRAPR